jgi:hypothetical protein
MANISNVGISILFSGSVANPINSATFQIVTPWGKSPVCASLQEAVSAVFEGKGGNPWTGKMGQFFLSQTLNGASTAGGPTAYFTANEVGSP